MGPRATRSPHPRHRRTLRLAAACLLGLCAACSHSGGDPDLTWDSGNWDELNWGTATTSAAVAAPVAPITRIASNENEEER